MAGYTKLFSSIVTSTVWREPDHVRLVWITLLALSDRHGVAEASIPGLADMAKVTLELCEDAILKLSSPDRYSRTKDFEGRRLEECDGGWRLINHGKYRAKMSADDRREYNRLKQAEHRAKAAMSMTVNDTLEKSAPSAHTEAKAEASPKAKAGDQNPPVRALRSLTKPATEPEAFTAFWRAYPKKVGKGAALRAWSKTDPPLEAVLSSLEWQCRQPDWLRDQGQYIPHPATWLNRRGWEDEPFHAPASEMRPTRPGRGQRVSDAFDQAAAALRARQES